MTGPFSAAAGEIVPVGAVERQGYGGNVLQDTLHLV